MAKYRNLTASLSKKTPAATPQNVQTPGTVMNNAGGFVYQIDKWDRLDRFLILGSDKGSFHVKAEKLSVENAKNIVECIKENGKRVVDKIVEVSDAGRAPKNDPALFALALAASEGDVAVRSYALKALPKVARIGTHLFQFAHYIDGFRGWGYALRSAVKSWYNEMDAERLALQVVKYMQRTAEEGNATSSWSHKDMLRKAHPVGDNDHNLIYDYVTKKGKLPSHVPSALRILTGVEAVKVATSAREVAKLVAEYDLPHEVIPKQFANDPEVWSAMIPHMGLTAMLRTLNRMTAYNVLKPLSSDLKTVISRLTNADAVKKARIHPLNVLNALKTYQSGHGIKGNLSWNPIREVSDALDDMLYMAFDSVQPSGKNILIALDISGSMASGRCAGMDNVSAREGAAVMAMATARAERNYHIVGFTANGWQFPGCTSKWGNQYPSGISPLNISPRQRLDDVAKVVSSLPMGGTNCALPMMYALHNKLDVDAFFVYTDNETWSGDIKPMEALRKYRASGKPQAKLVVVGTDATQFSIADPNDPGAMDVVGFDTSAPAVMSDFIARPLRRA